MKKNIYNKKQYCKRIMRLSIIGIIMLSIIFMVSIIYKVSLINYFKDFFSYSNYYLTKPISYVKDEFMTIKNAKKILKENEKLMDQNNSYDLIITENNNLKKELRLLKDELELKKVLADYNKISATVIERDKMYWFNNLTIDKGIKDKIEVGMIAINSNGLIGIIERVYNNSSILRLITTNNNNYKLSVYINNKEEVCHGLITGYDYDKNVLIISGISNFCKIIENSKVITSGMGKNYPSGILVGYVSSYVSDVYDTSKIVYVKSSQNFDEIKYVMVVKNI